MRVVKSPIEQFGGSVVASKVGENDSIFPDNRSHRPSKRKLLLVLSLSLFSIFSSALIAPVLFAPIRVPLYLVAILITMVTLTKRAYRFLMYPVVYSTMFLVVLLISAAANSTLDSPVVYRQFLYHVALFFCAYIGYMVLRSAEIWNIDFPRLLVTIFICLFVYGMYTYFAQVYELYEFLWFLRPSPSIRFLEDSEMVYTQYFHGALSRYRAYSVWYEPSFASLALACGLPLVFLCRTRMLSALLLLTAGGFAVLTYSRSAWVVCFIFVIIYFWAYTRLRLPVWVVGLLLIAMTPLSLIGSYWLVTTAPDVSTLTRFYNSVQAISELVTQSWGIVVGLGSPDLSGSTMYSSSGSINVTNAFIAMLRWLGIFGVILLLAPFIMLMSKARKSDDKIYWAILCFTFLVFVALNVGGNFVGMSLMWFFLGFNYGLAEGYVGLRDPLR